MYPERGFLNWLFLFLFLRTCTSNDTITPTQSIKHGDVLVSKGENFALGFFSIGTSSNQYIGIWYNKVSEKTVVWVANRDNPVRNNSGALSLDDVGNLVIYDPNRNVPLWSTNVSVATTNTTSVVAQLLDSGNLVLIQNDSKRVVWQSFDYPTNTMLPGMKLGLDRKTGLNRFLTSWKSWDDPGTGIYSYKFDIHGSPQLFLYKGSVRLWRTGPWNGLRWSGVPEMTPNFIFNATFVNNQDEISVVYNIRNTSIFSRMVVDDSGGCVERLTWHDVDRRWIGFWSAPKDRCDYYGQCGAFGNCDPYSPDRFDCTCLPGFEPKSPRDWYLRDGSGGCVRKRAAASICGGGEGFVKVARAKVPDTSMARVERSLSMKACEQECLRNCSCTGYSSADVNGGGSGCVTWFGDLMDIRVFSVEGQDLFVRVDTVELAQYAKKSKGFLSKKGMLAILVASLAVMSFLIVSLAYWLTMKKRKGRGGRREVLINATTSSTSFKDSPRANELDESGTNSDLPFFDLRTIVAATDDFSFANKLGQGGFGSVYKGQLCNGQEIAVKRLSKNSGQGIEEFKNEVTLIAKLQHRNLVRILGCCIQKEEKMLVYEYMPNKSLDSFIFDKTKGLLVDWRIRIEIIFGIARGLLYLHRDSRLRIIHRDLKASNVLLDATMNPKISDFGMARIFGGDQIEANTNRVVGTYGYMSPEYAMEGLFSTKSDVFSFGVLLLEIISGRKNNSYYNESPALNLTGHVWELWREGKTLNIVDSSLGESYPAHEVLRCIQIGLLCVQEFATDRPTMSEIVFMLGNETALPSPKQPAYIFKSTYNGLDPSTSSTGACSVNDVTLSTVQAR